MQQLHVSCGASLCVRAIVAHDTDNVLFFACRVLVAVLGYIDLCSLRQQSNSCGLVICQSAYRNMNLGQQAR